MRPYYEKDGIRIFHGCSMEVMPALMYSVDEYRPDFILSDPPYGISWKQGGISSTSVLNGGVHGDDAPFDPQHLLRWNLPTILWGANHYADKLPPSAGWLIWLKTIKFEKRNVLSDAELAWTNCMSRVRVFQHLWCGAFKDSERGEHYHPTQKPVQLFTWALSGIDRTIGLLVDPYMGAGPVLVAAKQLGLPAIGIEIEERYCEIAAKRLAQEVLDFSGAK